MEELPECLCQHTWLQANNDVQVLDNPKQDSIYEVS